MGWVERNELDPGFGKKSTTGLKGLQRKLLGEHDKRIGSLKAPDKKEIARRRDAWVAAELKKEDPKFKTEKEAIKAFYEEQRFVSNTFYVRSTAPSMKALSEDYSELKPFINTIFSLDYKKEDEYTFEKPKDVDKPARLTKSDEYATQEQTDNKRNNEQVPYILNTNLWEVVSKLLTMSKKGLLV